MVNMYLEINKFLSLLDSKEDFLLIEMLKLKQKLILKKHFFVEFPLTDKEKEKAKDKLIKSVCWSLVSELRQIPYYKKLSELIDKLDCDFCKFVEYKIVTFEIGNKRLGFKEIEVKTPIKESKRCLQCQKRLDLLNDKYNEIDEFIENAKNEIITNDVIILKAMIEKISKKLKTIKK